MPGVARIVVPGLPHHITQRGNNCQDVFFVDDDRRAYLWLLRERCAAAHVGGEDGTGLLDLTAWSREWKPARWREQLRAPEDEAEMRGLRLSTHTGRPLATFSASWSAGSAGGCDCCRSGDRASEQSAPQKRR